MMFKIIWFYCFIQISIIYYFRIGAANPIIGKAYKARAGRYPFVVSLSYSSGAIDIENHFCGGTLITKKLVLTSAHCIRGVNKDEVIVVVGTLDFSSGQIYTIESWITYGDWAVSHLLKTYGPKYTVMDSWNNPTHINNVESHFPRTENDILQQSQGLGNLDRVEISNLNNYYLNELLGEDNEDTDGDLCIPVATKNDIAIITLSHEVENVDPAKISVLYHDELIGQNAVTVGWGSVDDNTGRAPELLLKMNLRILRPFEIKKNYYKLFKKHANPGRYYYYTSADPPAVLGSGDSGGPLMLTSTKEIIGVNEGHCNNANPESSQYSMSRHVKLLGEYKEFIDDMKKQ